MIFKVNNLGQLKEAEVDLNKDLILLTGQNNTGKTYLAYAIYGFLECREILNAFDQNVIFFPAERTAINSFSKELDFLKNKVNRYPKPIQDSLKTAEDLLRISKHRQSEYSHLADELEKEILGGTISVSEYGDLRFKPENSEISPLEIHLTGSMIKSLAGISFYFRHLAQKHDCIIIDEPENHLHPDNQLKITRFFGRLINEGFKVIISTHSDYIIKEINNLVMLSKESEAQKELLKKYKYAENELIKPERIEALLFRKLDGNEQITPNKIEVSETGLSVETIDEEIHKLRNLSRNIYFELFEN